MSLPKTSGVYIITCNANGKVYIGGTFNLYKRRQRHLGDLKGGWHNNPILQSAWNEHGRSAFSFAILELCEPDVVRVREQHYLDTMQPFDDRGFNIGRDSMRPRLGIEWTPNQRAKITAVHSKTYIVTSPQGAQTQVTNLSKFCREQGLDHSTMSAVANGKTAQHKGWRCAHVAEQE